MFAFAYDIGVVSAASIPVLITAERILATVFPLTVYLYVTPQRAVVAVCCLYILPGVYCLYASILCMEFVQTDIQGVTIGRLFPTDLLVNHANNGVYQNVGETFNYMTGIIPIILVTVGCVIIWLKLLQITIKRRLLTSSQIKVITKHGITRTTKTLLSLCLLFIVCYSFGFAILYIEENELLQDPELLVCIQNFVSCINCIGDFLIYIGTNKIFRKSTVAIRR